MRRTNCVLFIFAGMAAIALGFWNLSASSQSRHWPIVDGTIVTSEMQTNSGKGGGVSYSADIIYQYQVDGVDYSGNRLAFGGRFFSSIDYARGILGHYPPGKKVQVHYSPGNPQFAVLETGIHTGTFLCFAAGVVFMAVGILLMFSPPLRTTA